MQITELLKLINSIGLESEERIKIILLIIFICIYLLSEIKPIFKPHERRSQKEESKIKQRKERLKDRNISDIEKRNIENEIKISRHIIRDKNVIKITNKSHLQAKILDLYEFAQGRLNYSELRIALPFFKIDSNDKLSIRKKTESN